MTKTDYKSVDGYIAAQPEASRPLLRCVRETLRKAVPLAEEMISYQIPAYKLSGAPVFYFAGWKSHYALYPVFDSLLAKFGDELTPFISARTLRFPLTEPVPIKLIARLAKFRAKEIADAAEAKSSKTKGKTKAKPAKKPPATKAAKSPPRKPGKSSGK